MIVNGDLLLAAAPIHDMLTTKVRHNGVSHGLAEVGYDIRIKQDIRFSAYNGNRGPTVWVDSIPYRGRFTIASAMEEFEMPLDLAGVVHDKSTWARNGLSVFNTVIEPGWKGFLTLELVYHGENGLHIPAGSGIAQVLFHQAMVRAAYDGKYQNQADKPVPAISE